MSYEGAPRVRLVKLLQECRALLRSAGERWWATKIEEVLTRCKQELRREEGRIILSWYGGMGSFADLWICTANGHKVEAGQEPELNNQLGSLREAIYEEARQLARQTIAEGGS